MLSKGAIIRVVRVAEGHPFAIELLVVLAHQSNPHLRARAVEEGGHLEVKVGLSQRMLLPLLGARAEVRNAHLVPPYGPLFD